MLSNSVHTEFVDIVQGISKHRVEPVGQSSNPRNLYALVVEVKPDVVFLDPDIDDGGLLGSWKNDFGQLPALVCATHEIKYAVNAFDAGAVHYLIPTFTLDKVTNAVNRVAQRINKVAERMEKEALANSNQQLFRSRILSLPCQDGFDVRHVDEVVRVNGEGNYTRVVIKPSESLLLSKCLGDLEPEFSNAGLLRVHRSHMINVNHIRRLKRGKSPILQMSNGDEIDVSRKYRDVVLELLNVRK